MSTTAANRIRAICWLPIAWFCLLGAGEIFVLTIYVIDRHEYRFPYDWGWSYRSSTNYVFAQIGGILFAVAGLALCWQARRSGKWIYGAIAIAAIALNYAIPDFCHIEPWLPPLRAVCGQEPG